MLHKTAGPETKVKEDALSQTQRAARQPGRKKKQKTKKAMLLILEEGLITVLLFDVGIYYGPKKEPFLFGVNGPWSSMAHYTILLGARPNMPSRPQGYSPSLHILLRLKREPLLFFSSLSDSVWGRAVN